jgi:hypothetical protein
VLREAAVTPNTKRTQRLRGTILGKLLGMLRIRFAWRGPTYAQTYPEDKYHEGNRSHRAAQQDTETTRAEG